MADASPIVLQNWDGDYPEFIAALDVDVTVVFMQDLINTINELHDTINVLEARIAALEA